MTLATLIDELERERRALEDIGQAAGDVDVVLWQGDDTVPVTGIDSDLFEVGGRWAVEIRKDGDP